MVQITATREIHYAGKARLPGETFDVSEKDAKIYVAIKRAKLARAMAEVPVGLKSMSAPQSVQPDVAVAAIEPAEPLQGEAAPEAQAHPRTYQRRDMVAEAGLTGSAKRSPSSPPAPPPEDQTSSD